LSDYFYFDDPICTHLVASTWVAPDWLLDDFQLELSDEEA
jgi:hypothetical protein